MSTYYTTTKHISIEKIKTLKKGVDDVWVYEIKNDSEVCLTDGTNYLWCYEYNDGEDGSEFCRYGRNSVTEILMWLSNKFNIGFIDEYSDLYGVYFSDEEFK